MSELVECVNSILTMSKDSTIQRESETRISRSSSSSLATPTNSSSIVFTRKAVMTDEILINSFSRFVQAVV